jgi:hypothetical protein
MADNENFKLYKSPVKQLRYRLRGSVSNDEQLILESIEKRSQYGPKAIAGFYQIHEGSYDHTIGKIIVYGDSNLFDTHPEYDEDAMNRFISLFIKYLEMNFNHFEQYLFSHNISLIYDLLSRQHKSMIPTNHMYMYHTNHSSYHNHEELSYSLLSLQTTKLQEKLKRYEQYRQFEFHRYVH